MALDWVAAGNTFHNSTVVTQRTQVLTAPHIFKCDFRRKTNLEDDQHQLDIFKRNVWSRCKWGLHGMWSRCKWGGHDQCMQHLVGDASKHILTLQQPQHCEEQLNCPLFRGGNSNFCCTFKSTNSISVVNSPSTKQDSDGCNWNLSSLLISFLFNNGSTL